MSVLPFSGRTVASDQPGRDDELPSAGGLRLSPICAAGSTLLPVLLGTEPYGPDPAAHAAGLLTSRGVVDLSNYEAHSDYFSISFRPERSPFPALGTFQQLGGVPPVLDSSRYEESTRGRVDFVLVQCGIAHESRWPEQSLYKTQIAAF